MSVASSIEAAIKSIVETEYATPAPGLKCHVRRASEKNPAYFVGMALPCFVVSINESRDTRMMTARKKFVKYVAALEYLSVELPGQRDPSAEAETILSRLSALFIKPRLTGVAAVSDVNVRPQKPYTLPFASGTANAAEITLTIEAIEDAN